MTSKRVLVVDLLPFEHSTRTRKIARTLAERGSEVEAVTLARVGRTGIQSDLPLKHNMDGVSVRLIETPAPLEARSFLATTYNIIRVYPAAVARLARIALQSPADSIFVGHMALFWIGTLHSRRFGSAVALNARERMGGVRTKGSLGTVFSRIEPIVIRSLKRSNATVVTVAEGHAVEYRRAGASRVMTIRNVPSRDFCPAYVDPPEIGPMRVALIGSLYDGRGVFPLISAVGRARRAGWDIQLEISGRGNPDFLSRMNDAIQEAGGSTSVRFLGECPSTEVPNRYQRAHLATALYEATDPANDSLSNKLFEGPASGRPVLAGALPENLRVVDDYRLGWTSEVTAEALTSALIAICKQRASLGQLGKHCFNVVQDELNWETESQALVGLLGDTRRPTPEHEFGHP